ncbi:MAG: DUF2286 domain-containing protein [Desulfurococcales archaeon]|nr:DUF2286 domain-containing protein [Desulfurococcales archaeon]
MVKVLVLRSEKGRITEKEVVEGDLLDVVRSVAKRALEEWDPANSDFIALKDLKEVELELPLRPDVVDLLREYGSLARAGGKAVGQMPVFTISFDNMMVGEDKIIENKIYLIAPHLGEDIETELEAMAAEYTAEREEAPGIEEA